MSRRIKEQYRFDSRRGFVRITPSFVTYKGCCHLCHNPVPLHEHGGTDKPIWCRPCYRKMKTECPNCGVQPGETHGFPDCPKEIK